MRLYRDMKEAVEKGQSFEEFVSTQGLPGVQLLRCIDGTMLAISVRRDLKPIYEELVKSHASRRH